MLAGRETRQESTQRIAILEKVAIHRLISDIDEQINDLLHEIVTHSAFQDLKSTWFGLRYLADETRETSVTLRVLDISYTELLKDFGFSIEFDQSHLFDKIYSQEFGVAGGTPYGAILCDHKIAIDSQSELNTYVGYLQSLSQIGAAAFCPFILGAPPELMDLDNYQDLSERINLHNTYRQLKFLKWNRFRAHPDARFIGMMLPRVLVDSPMHLRSKNGFIISESLATREMTGVTWMSPVYSMGKTLAHCFESTGWLAEICGVKTHRATVTEPSASIRGIMESYPCFHTEKLIHDDLSQSLSEFGFISLTSHTNSDKTLVYSTPSIHRDIEYQDSAAQHNARYASQLQYVLCVSRFSHYLKILIRDKVGSLTTVDECQAYLKGWLLNYVMSTSDASEQLLAKYPLREARVEVFELPGQAGVFKCVVKLTPHYQLESVETELLFSTDILQKR